MDIRAKLAAAGAATAVLAGSIAAAAPAGAATPEYARLTITPAGYGYYTVTVAGHANITGTPPQFNLAVNLYGEDEWFDDFLTSQSLHRTDPAGNFGVQFNVFHTVLNEDWGQDEVYAVASVRDKNGSDHRIRTNTVEGYY
jgi:hypothetical protein